MSEGDRGGKYAQGSKIARSASGPSTALVAVALQDHLAKQYSLSFSDPLSKKRSHPPSGPPPSTSQTSTGCSRCGKAGPRHNKGRQQQTVIVVNSDVLSLNSNCDGRERVQPSMMRPSMVRPSMVRPSASAVQMIVAPTTTGSGDGRRRQGSRKEVEHVLDKAQPSLSLAQRMGLVEAPPTLLSSAEWAKVKSMSVHRHDSASPCPICHEPFGLTKQVLLSCSHVFHLSCLRSLERFSQSKRCPMCRRDNYQKRVIYEGANYYRNWAAIVIQSLWRGYVVRKWYESVREAIPPQHPALRRKHFERRLQRLTERVVKSCDQRSSQADCVLAESDRAIEQARQATRIVEHTIADSALSGDWSVAYSKAKVHSMSECPVCLIGLRPQPSHDVDHTHQPRPIAVLSCGHLFHEKCIESLERHNYQGQGEIPLCPLCRTPYLRQIYELKKPKLS